VVVGLALRVYALGSQSFWIDEINVTSFVRSGHLFSDLRDRGGPFEPPLHFLSVWAALHLPIGFESAARVPSAFFGGLEVLALMLLTREATGRRAMALVAGLLLAVAPFAVRYSQENRYYVMFSALTLLTWWLLLRAVRLRSTVDWVTYGALTAMLQLTHPFAPLVLVAQALLVGAVLWRERSRGIVPLLRGYGIAVGTGLILILPWYLYGASRWIPNALDGKSYRVNPDGQFAVPLDGELFERGGSWLLGNSGKLTVLVAVLLLAALAAPLLARGRPRVVALVTLGYVLAFSLVLVPLSRSLGTYFAYRRVESLIPPMLLLAAVALVSCAERLIQVRVARPVAVGIGAVAVTVIAALSFAAVVDYYGTEKSNYRALARVVEHSPSNRKVVIGPVTPAVKRLIHEYLGWQGVDRRVGYLVTKRPWTVSGPVPREVTWLTGAPPRADGMHTRPLNDLDAMQVIAGDRSGLLVILPWFASTSHPRSIDELNAQRKDVVTLPPFLPAPP
jgi:Dolichyl-phosphate-mannose-protein mannosyltransferase